MPQPDPVHQEFLDALRGLIPYGGADVGEVDAVALEVVPGDDDSFFEALSAYARRRIDEADSALAAGHRATARECYLRAAAWLGMAYHPLYGTPVDPRLVDALHLQMDVFDKALALHDPAAERLAIPYEGTALPGYLLRAPAHAGEVRPLVIVGGGWDSTMVENHLGMGVAALARGYHVLLFDGPGQGRLLVDEGLTLRHDWEHVVTPVVDVAVGLDGVDPERIAFQPWSLGGYFAPRAAAHEPRLAAIVADPGQTDVGVKYQEAMPLFGLDAAAVARFPELSPADAATIQAVVDGDRGLHWQFVQRGFWTNGAADIPSYLAEMARWKLSDDEIAAVRCPTLVLSADGDRASTNAQELFDKLTCPKVHLHYTAADGAGMHCEMLNRSMANRQILDWLDDTLRP